MLVGPWRVVALVVVAGVSAPGLSVDRSSPLLSDPPAADEWAETYRVRVAPFTRRLQNSHLGPRL